MYLYRYIYIYIYMFTHIHPSFGVLLGKANSAGFSLGNVLRGKMLDVVAFPKSEVRKLLPANNNGLLIIADTAS